MSRHRNIKNLTDDDYYDGYDDDDYYDEEDDDYYDEEEEYYGKEKVKNTSTIVKSQKAAKGVQYVSEREQQQLHVKEQKRAVSSTVVKKEDKANDQKEGMVNQVVGMGFSSTATRKALSKYGWDVNRAVEALAMGEFDMETDNIAAKISLASSDSNITTNKTTTNAIHKKKVESAGGASIGRSGISPPPPGFSRPSTSSNKTSHSHTWNKNSVPVSAPIAPPTSRPTPDAHAKDLDHLKHTKAKATATSSTSKSISTLISKSQQSLETSCTSNAESTIQKKKISPQLLNELKISLKSDSRLGMVVLGHVDAGKSTLMGQILFQLGSVQRGTLNKYKRQAAEIGKASFALAWVMDEDDSERERGVTIDIATKFVSTQKHHLAILDAPGHADFVPAMITGAASADVGMLVVAATPNEFESGFHEAERNVRNNTSTSTNTGKQRETYSGCGQTREHIILARGLGVSQLIVAVNKLDVADPPWSRQRFQYIKTQLEPFIQSNGFNMKRVQFVPISGLTGVNVKDRLVSNTNTIDNHTDIKHSAAALAKWYNGPTLLQAIDNFEVPKRNIEKPFRAIALDTYAEGKGVTVKARVIQGLVVENDRINVLPIGDEVTVSRINHGVSNLRLGSKSTNIDSVRSTKDTNTITQLEQERMKVAIAGDIVDIVLGGIDSSRIVTGNVLADADVNTRPRVKKFIRAKILIMENLTMPIIRGAQVILHMHSLDIPAVICNIVNLINRKDGSLKMSPRILRAGENATVEIKLQHKICVEEFTKCKALGRVVLRRGGDTIAVGIIEK